jgi:hypothetical protein
VILDAQIRVNLHLIIAITVATMSELVKDPGSAVSKQLCRRTQQPNLTFCPVGGQPFGLWPLLLLRDGGKVMRGVFS